jgi:hypothetical protein
MNMTSRYGLLAGVAGLIWAGCSAPAEDVEDAPTLAPPGYSGQGGTAGSAPVTAGGTGGSGGSVPAPTAGTGGTGLPAAGGSAGAPAAGGTGGAGGGGAIPTGVGKALTHDSTGWVAGTTNQVGIQGSFHTISDGDGTPPGDTTVTLGQLATPTSVCVSGVASQVIEMNYAQYWGGGLGLNLADPGGGAAPGPWTPGAVTGFTFTVTGTMIPANFRFNAVSPAGGDPYCGDIATGANSIALTSLLQACYNGATAGPALTTATPITSIQWQVVTGTDATTPFDFCIENLTATP